MADPWSGDCNRGTWSTSTQIACDLWHNSDIVYKRKRFELLFVREFAKLWAMIVGKNSWTEIYRLVKAEYRILFYFVLWIWRGMTWFWEQFEASFSGHCGTFCGLKGRFWCAKMHLACSHALMIVQTVMLSYFSVYNFLTSSNVIQIVIGFVFLDINMFWAFLGAHFNPITSKSD